MTGDTTPRWQPPTMGERLAPLDRSLFAWLDSEGIWVGVVRLRALSARTESHGAASQSDPDLCLVAHGDANGPSQAHLFALSTIVRDLPLHLSAVETFLRDNDIVFEVSGAGSPGTFRHQTPICMDILSVEACDPMDPQRVALVLLTEQPDEWATYWAIVEQGALVSVTGRND